MTKGQFPRLPYHVSSLFRALGVGMEERLRLVGEYNLSIVGSNWEGLIGVSVLPMQAQARDTHNMPALLWE